MKSVKQIFLIDPADELLICYCFACGLQFVIALFSYGAPHRALGHLNRKMNEIVKQFIFHTVSYGSLISL